MHVLIVAYHFPPDAAVGALRPARIAQAFAARGHRVSVVTAGATGEQPYHGLPGGVVVSAVRPLKNPRELYLALKRVLRGDRRSGTTAATPPRRDDTEAPSHPTPAWKRWVFSLVWLPDDRQGFIPAAIAAARRIHHEQPVDLTITTAPPFSSLLAGLRISRLTGARWVADFRDPWTGNPWKPAHVRTETSDRIERWLERRVLRRADLVTAASDGIRDILERHGVQRERSLVVRNGIEQMRTRPVRRPEGPFRILHMGTFYHGRNPRPFLQALARVRARYPGRSLQVDFVGKSRTFQGESIPEMVSELGLKDIVTFHDFKSREEVNRMAAASDLLLLLAQNQPDQVPQKLYEYLGTRVPVLAFADDGGESASMLGKAGGHYVVTDDDVELAAAALESAIANADGSPAGDLEVLETWTSEAQIGRLITAVGG